MSISVIMSVNNGSDFVEKTIDSVLNQSYPDFEFLIMDDGSTDDTLEKINNYSIKDKRIIIFSQQNKGLTKSLNYLINNSSYEIIARIDADDLCHKNRFKRQYEFLAQNKKYSLVGSNAVCIDSRGEEIKNTNLPLSNFFIKQRINFYNTFIHSSVMFRKNKFIEAKGYDESFPVSQDYDLWLKMSKLKDSKFLNLKERQISLRLHNDSISERNKNLQNLCAAFSIYKSKKNLKLAFDQINLEENIKDKKLFLKIKLRILFIQKDLQEFKKTIKDYFSLESYLLFLILFFYMKFFSKK